MQQTQEQLQSKTVSNHEQAIAFHSSPLPAILSVSGKACYGLSAVAIALSVGIWNRAAFLPPALRTGKKAANSPKVKPTREQYYDAQRLGAFVGLWAPTLVIAGKALEDASEQVARSEFERWERRQVEKTRSAAFRSRFFNR